MKLIPPADLDIPGFGRVYAGQPVDIPAELAGRPPDPRLEPAMVDLAAAVAAIDHHAAAQLREEIAGLDYGAGLLAQGWPVAEGKKKATSEAAASSEEGVS